MTSARRFVLAALVLSTTAVAAMATTPLNMRHWRWRNHVPPLPYPELLHPEDNFAPSLPSGFTMTLVRGSEPIPGPSVEIDKPRDVARRLAGCWNPPVLNGDPAEVTLRVQFSKTGRVIGEPKITYVKAAANERGRVAESLLKALSDCTPLRFTASLGAAIAGYPFAIRFIADRRRPDAKP